MVEVEVRSGLARRDARRVCQMQVIDDEHAILAPLHFYMRTRSTRSNLQIARICSIVLSFEPSSSSQACSFFSFPFSLPRCTFASSQTSSTYLLPYLAKNNVTCGLLSPFSNRSSPPAESSPDKGIGNEVLDTGWIVRWCGCCRSSVCECSCTSSTNSSRISVNGAFEGVVRCSWGLIVIARLPLVHAACPCEPRRPDLTLPKKFPGFANAFQPSMLVKRIAHRSERTSTSSEVRVVKRPEGDIYSFLAPPTSETYVVY